MLEYIILMLASSILSFGLRSYAITRKTLCNIVADMSIYKMIIVETDEPLALTFRAVV